MSITIGFRKLGFLFGFRDNKNEDRTVVTACDDDCVLDPTEDKTSVGSDDVLELEQAAFAVPSVVFFIDNLNCSSDQLHNRRLLKLGLILDPL